MANKQSPESQLLDALFGGLTEEESKYLAWLHPRVCSSATTVAGTITVARARELFLKRFPKTRWMRH